MEEKIVTIRKSIEALLIDFEEDKFNEKNASEQIEDEIAIILDRFLNSNDITDYEIIVKDDNTTNIPNNIKVTVNVQSGEFDDAKFYCIDALVFIPENEKNNTVCMGD